jgi:hypothetical protein
MELLEKSLIDFCKLKFNEVDQKLTIKYSDMKNNYDD